MKIVLMVLLSSYFGRHSVQARKKSTKTNFLGLETARWGGSLPREGGGGRKSRALPRKFVFLGFRREESGMSRPGILLGCPGTPGGVQKVCGKQVRAHFSLPISGGMDWWRMEWQFKFPESGKWFSEAEISSQTPEIPQSDFHQIFRLRKFEISEPDKCNSIPPAMPYPHYTSSSIYYLVNFSGWSFLLACVGT